MFPLDVGGPTFCPLSLSSPCPSSASRDRTLWHSPSGVHRENENECPVPSPGSASYHSLPALSESESNSPALMTPTVLLLRELPTCTPKRRYVAAVFFSSREHARGRFPRFNAQAGKGYSVVRKVAARVLSASRLGR